MKEIENQKIQTGSKNAVFENHDICFESVRFEYDRKETDRGKNVLEDGRVKEQGTHEELLKYGGLYNKLWNLQTKSAEWAL